ncbi:hypothetical protein GTP23_11275 [Pseudoduganella sp. FT93W]|uniref:DUF928 domain-containing protein n=1 Tax=Duganella fentianensis TaxID=2692177 RepID=A0A845HXB5_9BURK|nr:hypothetical protein [Duganella fentianensis]MYN45629.1 hypothetical protein [Duganella fentianensis]
MLKSMLVLSLSLSTAIAAHAATDCSVPPLGQSDKSAPVAEAAKRLRATDPCKVVPGLSGKSLGSVWAGLLSTKKTGGRRLEPAIPDGMPNGTVLAGSAGVHFDLRAVAGEGIRSFLLARGAQTLATPANGALEFDVPVSGGDAYQWTLVTRVATYHGEYTLADAAERQEVEQQLAQLDKAGLDPVARLLYQAAIYDDANLFVERDRVYAQLRAMLAL